MAVVSYFVRKLTEQLWATMNTHIFSFGAVRLCVFFLVIILDVHDCSTVPFKRNNWDWKLMWMCWIVWFIWLLVGWMHLVTQRWPTNQPYPHTCRHSWTSVETMPFTNRLRHRGQVHNLSLADSSSLDEETLWNLFLNRVTSTSNLRTLWNS